MGAVAGSAGSAEPGASAAGASAAGVAGQQPDGWLVPLEMRAGVPVSLPMLGAYVDELAAARVNPAPGTPQITLVLPLPDVDVFSPDASARAAAARAGQGEESAGRFAEPLASVALGLGRALRATGIHVRYADVRSAPDLEATLVVALDPRMDPRAWSLDAITVAWPLGNIAQWLRAPGGGAFDAVIPASSVLAARFADAHPQVLPVLQPGVDLEFATDPGPGGRAGVSALAVEPFGVLDARDAPCVAGLITRPARVPLAVHAERVMPGLQGYRVPGIGSFARPGLFARSRVVVIERSKEARGWGMGLELALQAAACGALPVVHGPLGTAEVFGDAASLVPVIRDVQELSAVLSGLLQDPMQASYRAAELSQKVRAGHGYELRAAQLIQMLEGLPGARLPQVAWCDPGGTQPPGTDLVPARAAARAKVRAYPAWVDEQGAVRLRQGAGSVRGGAGPVPGLSLLVAGEPVQQREEFAAQLAQLRRAGARVHWWNTPAGDAQLGAPNEARAALAAPQDRVITTQPGSLAGVLPAAGDAVNIRRGFGLLPQDLVLTLLPSVPGAAECAGALVRLLGELVGDAELLPVRLLTAFELPAGLPAASAGRPRALAVPGALESQARLRDLLMASDAIVVPVAAGQSVPEGGLSARLARAFGLSVVALPVQPDADHLHQVCAQVREGVQAAARAGQAGYHRLQVKVAEQVLAEVAG